MSKITTKKLHCGITVVMEKIDYVQSAAFGVWVKAGAVDETADQAGISHFIEHMMFKGTEKRSARQIAEDVDRIGGQINAFTGKEATCYYVKTIGTHLKKGAEVILDMVNNAVFDQDEMNRERKVICEEIKMIEDQPDDLAHDTVTELVFRGSRLSHSIIGTSASLDKINRAELTAYKQNHYTKDNLIVSVAGNFDEEVFCDFLEKQFDGLKSSGSMREKEIAVPYEKSFQVITKDIQQSHVCLATKGVSLTDSRYHALSVLNNIMGGSMSSRLFQNIREEKGLAYSVYSMNSGFSSDGYYNIYAGISHDKIADALTGIEEELEILKRGGVTEDELRMSKEQIKASYIFGQENVASRMFANGKNVLLLQEVIEPEEVIQKIDVITMDKIDEAKELICDPDGYTGVCVTNKEIDFKDIWKWY